MSCNNRKIYTIGIAEDQTTNIKTISESLTNGRNLAIQSINESNLPFKLKLKVVDTANNPEKTANAFRSLCDNDKVDLLIGVPSISCSQIAKYIANNRKKVFISEAFDETITKNVNYTLSFNQNPYSVGKYSTLYFFYILKKNKMAILYDNSNQSFLSQLKGFKEVISTGISVSEEPFDGRKEKKDFSSNFARLKGINPEVIFILADPSLYRDIILNAKQILGDSVLFVLNNIPEFETIKNNKSFENVYIISNFYENKNKFIESDFYKIYKSKFESNPTFYSALGFDANGLAIKPIDILKITNGSVTYVGEFHMEDN